MLKIRRIEIDKFAFFDRVVIEPSVDSERPLTVLRAENGSGKTTFLRALRWGMYGELGLPEDAARYSLHPPWWRSEAGGVKTSVSIEFETEGSSPAITEGHRITTVYQLIRSVTTIGNSSAGENIPDFRRINEHSRLMVKTGTGLWEPHTAGVDHVVQQLLPRDLRDFFVMDADEVTDFVGGSENKVMRRQDVIDKTTAAIHSLLGIDVFRKVSERVEKIGLDFDSQATRALGDVLLNAMQDELEQLRDEKRELRTKISEQKIQMDELNDRLGQRNNDLETELKDIGAEGELKKRLAENRRQYDRAIKQRGVNLSDLVRELEATDLLASLAARQIKGAYDMLQPLYERGHIPLRHLHFVREMFESGICICSQDLTLEGIHRRHVAERIAESEKQEERARLSWSTL